MAKVNNPYELNSSILEVPLVQKNQEGPTPVGFYNETYTPVKYNVTKSVPEEKKEVVVVQQPTQQTQQNTNTPKGMKEYKYGKWTAIGNPTMIDAFQRANENYYKQTGQYMSTTETYRTPERQDQLYSELKAKNPKARVLKSTSPGYQYAHGLGYSIDLPNHYQDPNALKLLNSEGFVNGISGDLNHFYHRSVIDQNKDWFKSNAPSIYSNYVKLYG